MLSGAGPSYLSQRTLSSSERLAGARQSPGAAAKKTVMPQANRDVSSRFGDRLRELRKSRNLTQLQMAVSFGIDRSYISDVERGRKGISLPTLEVIALGMRVSLSDLLQDL